MSFSIHAFYKSLTLQATPTYTNLTPLSDPIATVNNNLLYVGALNNLIGALEIGTTAGKSKVETPSLLNIAPMQIVNIPQSDLPVVDMTQSIQSISPFKLVTNEAIQVFASNTSTANPSGTLALVFLSDGALAPITGEIIHARSSVVTSAVANSWENETISFDTVLPAGNYDVVGARLEGAHTKAFRFVFQGDTSVRPGTLAALGVNGNDVEGSRNGGWGTWGSFDQFTPPTIDIINDGTSETATLYIDLIKKT